MKVSHDLDTLPRQLRHEVAEKLQHAGQAAERASRAYTGFGGTIVKSDTKAHLVSPTELRITNANPIAPFLEYGTKPHEIVARRAPRLVFEVEGRLVVTRKVHHPGNRAHHFVEKSAEVAVEQFTKEFTK